MKGEVFQKDEAGRPEAGRPGDWEAGRPGDWVAGGQGGREAGRPGDREAGRPGDREAGRPGDREGGDQIPGARKCSGWQRLLAGCPAAIKKAGPVHPANRLGRPKEAVLERE
jgi:hypothetical protein